MKMDPEFVVRILWMFLGTIAILYAVFGERLMGPLGQKPRSELFQTPRFRRSARLNERLARFFMVPFGLGLLFRGIGPAFFSEEVMGSFYYVFLGLMFITLLVMVGVIVINWRNDE